MLITTDKTVEVIAGSGNTGNNDGTSTSATFTQLQGLCSEDNTLYVTDVAAGCVKIVAGLSGTIKVLKNLGSLYNSFGIHAKGAEATHISLHDAATNVSNICSYFKNTVTDVKETKRIAGVTNGPEGTISAKTNVSLLEQLHSGMESLVEVFRMHADYDMENLYLSTLLTTMVENLHAVSHFKNNTFSVLQYSMDFGTIVKESLKRISKWAAKYFTHSSSYYPVPETHVNFKDLTYIAPSPSANMTSEDQQVMKEWMEPFRLVRQRTVRGETTKDRASALPPSVYTKPQRQSAAIVFDSDQQLRSTPSDMVENELEDEYETDSDSDDSNVDLTEFLNQGNIDHTLISRSTRSGRTVRAAVRLDL